MKNVKKSPEERKKFLDEMIKWRRKGAIVGGIWGLICGVWVWWNFSPCDVTSSMFDSFLEIIIFFPVFGTMFDSFLEIIIFFPVFVTDRIINYLFKINEILVILGISNEIVILAIPILASLLWFFIVWSIKISRKICIGGGLLLLILTISLYPLAFLLGPLSVGLLSITGWFGVVAVLLSVAFGILIASLLCHFLSSSIHEA